VTAAQRVLLSIDISTCRVRSSKPTVHRCCCQSVDRQTLNRFMTLTAYNVQSNSSMHRNECIALCKNISLQRGRFCTRSLASCIPRSSKDRSCSSSRLWAATPVVFFDSNSLEKVQRWLGILCVLRNSVHTCPARLK